MCMTVGNGVSDPILDEIKRQTALDEDLTTLFGLVKVGWPERKDQLPVATRPYYHLRDEIMIEDGILYKGNRKHLRHSNEQMEDENTYSWEFNAEGEGKGAEKEKEEEEESNEETPSLHTHAP